MKSELVVVECPKCGNSANISIDASRYGYEFRCNYCKSLSILIAGNKAVERTHDQRICLSCGTLCGTNDKYCQCGDYLLQDCMTCGIVIPRINKRCGNCGMSVSIQGADRKIAEIEQLISSYDAATKEDAENILREICFKLPTPFQNDNTDNEIRNLVIQFMLDKCRLNCFWISGYNVQQVFLLRRLGKYGECFLPFIEEYLKKAPNCNYGTCCSSLFPILSTFEEKGISPLIYVLERYLREEPDFDFLSLNDLEKAIASYGKAIIPKLAHLKPGYFRSIWGGGKEQVVTNIISRIRNPSLYKEPDLSE